MEAGALSPARFPLRGPAVPQLWSFMLAGVFLFNVTW